MRCQLIQVQTQDRVSLNGAFFRSSADRQSKIDAAIVVHGLAGNFYTSRLQTMLRRGLLQIGIDVLQANTRGHDFVNLTQVADRSCHWGAAFEIVDQCRDDIQAWVRFLAARQYQRVALVGHSLGAIKSIYAQAYQPQERVVAIAAVSASRLNYEAFLQSARGEQFRHWIGLAQERIAAEQADQLMHVDFPFDTLISAGAYLEKYGPENRYDWTRYLSRISVPVLMMFGETETQTNEAFRGVLGLIESLELTNVATTVVNGANHFYSRRRKRTTSAVCQWLIQL